MAKQHVMDHTGHTTIEFDPSNTTQLDEALARHKELTAAGATSATRNAGEKDYTVARAFDPTADETLYIPRLQGG